MKIFFKLSLASSTSLFLLLAFTACQEVVDWEYQPGDNEALVVEAILTNEQRHQEIRLSKSYDQLNGASPPATAAAVSISDGENTFPFQEDAAIPGLYQSIQAFAAQMGTRYTLQIQWEEQRYEAQNEMVPVWPMPNITFNRVLGTDSMMLAPFAVPYDPFQEAMYEVAIDWSHLSLADSSRMKLFFYTLSTVDVSELFRPPRETVVFPRGSIVIVKKFALNDSFAAFTRAQLMETEWQGGIYDEDSDFIAGNISNGGLGFFGVCAVLSDTLVAF